MRQKKTADFKRGLRAFAKQNGLLVEEAEGKGPAERIVLYENTDDGEIRRIATIVLRKDEKEISQGVARAITRKIRERLEAEGDDLTNRSIDFAKKALFEWISSWFL